MASRKSIRKRRVYRSDEAKVDLIQVWLFIAQDILLAANQLLSEIGKQMYLLAHTPRMGRSRSEIRKDLYSFPFEKYTIYYTIDENSITIIRVLHSARDIKSIW